MDPRKDIDGIMARLKLMDEIQMDEDDPMKITKIGSQLSLRIKKKLNF